jgi:hypothetical protein
VLTGSSCVVFVQGVGAGNARAGCAVDRRCVLKGAASLLRAAGSMVELLVMH